MPIPDEHLNRLRSDLGRHEQELLRLREQQVRLNTEVSVHQTIIALGRDGRVLAFLDELVDNPDDILPRLLDDQKAVLESFDLRLPDWLTVTVSSEPTMCVRANFSVNGTRFYMQWHEKSGFAVADDEVG